MKTEMYAVILDMEDINSKICLGIFKTREKAITKIMEHIWNFQRDLDKDDYSYKSKLIEVDDNECVNFKFQSPDDNNVWEEYNYFIFHEYVEE